jgi:GNAT superfamily N-acetyltransferase
MPTGLPLRLARIDDEEAIRELMQASIRALFPRFYPTELVEPCALYIGVPDRDLIGDGTYFVAEADGEIVACGGWSRRDKLYTGSGAAAGGARLLDPEREPARVRAMFVREDHTRRGLGRAILEACEAAANAQGFRLLALMATLPGEPLYRSFGFREVERVEITLPDGTQVPCVAMDKPVA